MVKPTPEEKKQREIAKWEKEKAKATLPGYMAYFLLIICVVYIGDKVVTQLGGQMQSIIPGMLVGLILMMLKVKETNGVDMGAVSAE